MPKIITILSTLGDAGNASCRSSSLLSEPFDKVFRAESLSSDILKRPQNLAKNRMLLRSVKEVWKISTKKAVVLEILISHSTWIDFLFIPLPLIVF